MAGGRAISTFCRKRTGHVAAGPNQSIFRLSRCLEVANAHLPQEPGRELDPRLKQFVQDVVIKDSSGVRLHASRATKFPATRSRKVAAGVKVDTLVSVCANGPKSVALVGERTHDVKLLRLGGWVKDRILLADLGYYSHRLFAKIEEYGGFFVSRWKKSTNPLFVRSLTVHRGQAIDLEGKRLSEVLPRLEREVLDARSSSRSSDASTTAAARATRSAGAWWPCGTRRDGSTTST